jgi:hypothetical protein
MTSIAPAAGRDTLAVVSGTRGDTAREPDPTFPVARCAVCDHDVLTHVVATADDASERRCVHCDAAIEPEHLRRVLESELDALGYGLDGAAGGCGSGSCGTGGCGH